MICEFCNKDVEQFDQPETLVDGQCFNCGSILTQEEIDALKNS